MKDIIILVVFISIVIVLLGPERKLNFRRSEFLQNENGGSFPWKKIVICF